MPHQHLAINSREYDDEYFHHQPKLSTSSIIKSTLFSIMSRQYITNGYLHNRPPPPRTLEIVGSSVCDSLVMTFFLITLLPGILVSWLGPKALTWWCFPTFLVVLLDNGPRLQFFVRQSSWSDDEVLLSVALAMSAFFLELLCLVCFAASGYPTCECYLLPCFIVSSLSRMLHRYAGGDRFPRQGLLQLIQGEE